jgi:hypothetical protein
MPMPRIIAAGAVAAGLAAAGIIPNAPASAQTVEIAPTVPSPGFTWGYVGTLISFCAQHGVSRPSLEEAWPKHLRTIGLLHTLPDGRLDGPDRAAIEAGAAAASEDYERVRQAESENSAAWWNAGRRDQRGEGPMMFMCSRLYTDAPQQLQQLARHRVQLTENAVRYNPLP